MNPFKRITGRLLSMAIVLCLSKAVSAQGQAQSFSMKQAIEYALKNNTAAKNAQADVELAKAKKSEVIGMGLPQVSGSFDLKNYLEVPTMVVPASTFNPSAPEGETMALKFGTTYTTTAGIQVSQLLFSSDYLVALSSSGILNQLAQKGLERTNIETAAEVSKAYYNVLVTRERLKLMNSNLERLKKLLDDTKALHKNGFVEKIDADRVEVLYNNMVVEQQKVARLAGLTEALLKFQMGYDVTAPIVLTDTVNMSEQAQLMPVDSAAKINPTKRIEYSLLEAQMRLNQADLRRHRLGFLPTVALYGSLSTLYASDEFEPVSSRWYPTAVIGGTLSVPIFTGTQRHYRVQQARLNVIKTENNMSSLQNAIALEVSTASVNYQNAYGSLKVQQKNMELAQEVYRVSKLKYEQGVGSNLEVITAETSLKEAQTNYYNALFDALIAKVDYEKANGTLIK
jgi:outer membrane protein